MNKNNHLAQKIFMTILFFGLVRCGVDNPKNRGTTQNAWAIKEPVVVREGQEPQNFTLAEAQSKEFTTSTELRFDDPQAHSENMKLNIKSDCLMGHNAIETHQYKETLRNKYYFFEFLSSNALQMAQDSSTRSIQCRLSFMVTNQNGDTHRFKTQMVSIGIKNHKESIPIFLMNSPVIKNESEILALSQAQLKAYSLPSNHQKNYNYVYKCTNSASVLNYSAHPVELDRFNGSNMKIEQARKNISEKQLCRIYEVANTKHVTGMTDAFIIKKNESAPIVRLEDEATKVTTIALNRSHVIATYSLQNILTRPMDLAIAGHGQPVAEITVAAYSPKDKKYYGYTFMAPTYLKLVGAPPEYINNELVFSLPPKLSVRVEATWTLKKVTCPGLQVEGLYYRLLQDQNFSGAVMGHLDDKENTDYVESQFSFDTNFQRYALLVNYNHMNLERTIKLHKGLKNVNPPKILNVKSNICSVLTD